MLAPVKAQQSERISQPILAREAGDVGLWCGRGRLQRRPGSEAVPQRKRPLGSHAFLLVPLVESRGRRGLLTSEAAARHLIQLQSRRAHVDTSLARPQWDSSSVHLPSVGLLIPSLWELLNDPDGRRSDHSHKLINALNLQPGLSRQ